MPKRKATQQVQDVSTAHERPSPASSKPAPKRGRTVTKRNAKATAASTIMPVAGGPFIDSPPKLPTVECPKPMTRPVAKRAVPTQTKPTSVKPDRVKTSKAKIAPVKTTKAKPASIKKKVCKERKNKTGYYKAELMPEGLELTDLHKTKWNLGKQIGIGGFGRIYSASKACDRKLNGTDGQYVIKIEPKSNGPLFVEIHTYLQLMLKNVDDWKEYTGLSHLGLPRFVGHGRHVYNGTECRFLVMERLGNDLDLLFEKRRSDFTPSTIYSIGITMLNALEYIHKHGYIHGDIKGSNILLGFNEENLDKVVLVDFGIAQKFIHNGIHKPYIEDKKRAHDGTIEFTSRDAHLGAVPSRRSDLEILGYVMTRWLCEKLPWEDNLTNLEYVKNEKLRYCRDIKVFMRDCFQHTQRKNECPETLERYMQYAVGLDYKEEPDYTYARNILQSGMKRKPVKGLSARRTKIK